MREIYNEGRIVGPGAYELYARQNAIENRQSNLITERGFLSSLMSSNRSMILKISNGTEPGYHDYVLPEGSKLCGCTFIKGVMFEGQVELDDDGTWATSVLDYGRLVSNSPQSNPVTPGESGDIPSKPNAEYVDEDLQIAYRNYLKITGGRMFQPGEWHLVSEHILCKQINPDLKQCGFVRLAVSEYIERDIYILLSGFSNKEYLDTVCDPVVSLPSNHTADGDFLGPLNYPWACPIELLSTNAELINWRRYVEDKIELLDERSRYLMTFHLMEGNQ